MAAPLASSDYLSEPLSRFLELIALEESTPGGGSVAAVAVAMAAALAEMAARFSKDWPEAPGVVAQAKALRERAAPLAQADAEAYEEYLAAIRLPKDLDSEVRDATIGRALSRAAEVPLAIAEAGADVAALGALAAEHGNPNLRGDAVTAALLGEAGARAAANLVAVNLGTTEQDERVRRARQAVVAAAEAAQRALAAGA